MSEENSRTIDSYESRANEYVAATSQVIHGPMKAWLDQSVEGLPLEASILEVGSGFGRDARYLQDKGYSVQCSDATKSFLAILAARGFETRELNIITDDIDGSYDSIIANAVLLHFTDDEVKSVLTKVYEALTVAGRFSFSVIKGEGEQWTDGKLGLPRYFNYMTEESLRTLLDGSGYRSCEINIAGKLGDREWLMVTAYR